MELHIVIFRVKWCFHVKGKKRFFDFHKRCGRCFLSQMSRRRENKNLYLTEITKISVEHLQGLVLQNVFVHVLGHLGLIVPV